MQPSLPMDVLLLELMPPPRATPSVPVLSGVPSLAALVVAMLVGVSVAAVVAVTVVGLVFTFASATMQEKVCRVDVEDGVINGDAPRHKEAPAALDTVRKAC